MCGICVQITEYTHLLDPWGAGLGYENGACLCLCLCLCLCALIDVFLHVCVCARAF